MFKRAPGWSQPTMESNGIKRKVYHVHPDEYAHRHDKNGRGRCYLLCCTLWIFIAVGLAIGLAFVLIRESDDDDDNCYKTEVITTKPSTTVGTKVVLNIQGVATVTDWAYESNMSDTTSDVFSEYSERLCSQVRRALWAMDEECSVLGIRNGSVIFDFLVTVPRDQRLTEETQRLEVVTLIYQHLTTRNTEGEPANVNYRVQMTFEDDTTDFCETSSCSQVCYRVPFFYKCECNPGYLLADDGHTCTDILECSSNPCRNGGTCTEGVNQFTCDCPKEFNGTFCELGENCYVNPCQHGGRCEDTGDSFLCTCPPGYSGDTCQHVIYYCEPNPCRRGGLCTDVRTGFECACPRGYRGMTCEEEIPCENEELFRCNDGDCISPNYRCDGVRHCTDGSDEVNCRASCKEEDFRCGDGQKCITTAWVCDGALDCADGSDEKGCECGDNQQKCDNDICVEKTVICNSANDCGDWSDEVGCECTSQQFRCTSPEVCLDVSYMCDGINHCPDSSDEAENCSYACAASSHVPCHAANRCYSFTDACNGLVSCDAWTTDGSLQGCQCSDSQFQCDMGLCRESGYWCDGNVDCPDASDERCHETTPVEEEEEKATTTTMATATTSGESAAQSTTSNTV